MFLKVKKSDCCLHAGNRGGGSGRGKVREIGLACHNMGDAEACFIDPLDFEKMGWGEINKIFCYTTIPNRIPNTTPPAGIYNCFNLLLQFTNAGVYF